MSPEFLGMCSAFLTTTAYLPQTWSALRTGNLAALSFSMFATISIGKVSWVTYGAMAGSLPILLANGVSLIMTALILTLKIQQMMRGRLING